MKGTGVILARLIAALILAVSGSGIIDFNVFYIVFSWWTIKLSYLLMNLFHGAIYAGGNIIVVGKNVIELIPACVAASAYLLLALLILFTRGISLKKGLMLFLIGSVLILVANVIRIEILTALLLNNGVNYFEALHLFFWKILSSVYVAAVWIFLCWWFQIKEIPVYSDFIALRHLSKKH